MTDTGQGDVEKVARIVDPKGWAAFDRVVEYQQLPQAEAPWSKFWADLADYADRARTTSLTKAREIIAALKASPPEGWDRGSVAAEPLPVLSPAVCEPSRHRWPKRGDRMRFLGKNGYEFELKAALGAFTIGQELVVASCDVGGWSHSVTFDGQPGSWNGVMFELMPPDDGSRHPSAGDGEGAVGEAKGLPTEHNTPPNIPTAETGGQ